MKYVPGLMVGQLSGKAGSTVASRNKGGSYFRTRVIPKHVVNVNTTIVRDNFGANAQAYSQLQEAQRLAWTSLGAQVTRKTSLGETIHLTGLQVYQMINRNRLSLGLGVLADAPNVTTPPAMSGVGITVAAGAPETTTVVLGANSATQHVTSSAAMFAGAVLYFATEAVYRTVVTVTDGTHIVLDAPVNSTTAENINWTGIPTVSLDFGPDPLPGGIFLQTYLTGPLSAGVARPSKGAFRYLGADSPAGTSPVDLAPNYVSRFGLPPAGSKVFFRVRLCTAEGFQGPEYADFGIVA